MKVIERIGMRVCRSFCAVMMGPTALVRKCFEKSSKELVRFSIRLRQLTVERYTAQWLARLVRRQFQVMGEAQSH